MAGKAVIWMLAVLLVSSLGVEGKSAQNPGELKPGDERRTARDAVGEMEKGLMETFASGRSAREQQESDRAGAVLAGRRDASAQQQQREKWELSVVAERSQHRAEKRYAELDAKVTPEDRLAREELGLLLEHHRQERRRPFAKDARRSPAVVRAAFERFSTSRTTQTEEKAAARVATVTSGVRSVSGLLPPEVTLMASMSSVDLSRSVECRNLASISVTAHVYVPLAQGQAKAVLFEDVVPSGTSLVVGSVRASMGSVTIGNAVGDASVEVQLDTLPVGVTIFYVQFDVLLEGGFTGRRSVSDNLARLSFDFFPATELTTNDIFVYFCEDIPSLQLGDEKERLSTGETVLVALAVAIVILLVILALLVCLRFRGGFADTGSSFYAGPPPATDDEEERYAQGRQSLSKPQTQDSVTREYGDVELDLDKKVDLGQETEGKSTRRPGLGGALAVESSSLRDYRKETIN